MGTYTGIRFKGYVKEEFKNMFDCIAMNGDWGQVDNTVFKGFSNVPRSSFIPCGCISYMPDSWEEDFKTKEGYGVIDYLVDGEDPKNCCMKQATDGFENQYNKDTGYWAFQCSLKDYDDTIEKFIEMIPYFIESIDHLEVKPDYSDFGKLYNFKDGIVVETGERIEYFD